jgi:hypothetical protein
MPEPKGAQITISLPGLIIAPEEREAWQKTAKDMAAAADSLRGLEPLESEPLNLFNPRFKQGAVS